MDTIHFSRCRMMPTPSSLAFRLGLFDGLQEAVGQDVKLEFGDYDHGQDRLWVRHASNGKGFFSRSRGAKTRLIAFSPFENAWPVWARADSPIRDAADLKGRRVLIPKVKGRAFDVERHLYLKSIANALASKGLGLQDIEIVDLEFERDKRCDLPPESRYFFDVAAERSIEWLRDGKVDAITTVLPTRLRQGLDLRVVYDGRNDPSAWARGELRTLTASEALVEERPEFLVELLVRLIKAGEWASSHISEVPALVAADIQLTTEQLLDHEVDLGAWARVDCSPDQIEQMRARRDYLRSVGGLEGEVDVDAWIAPRFVKAARERLANEGVAA